jgi:hypothetical protein
VERLGRGRADENRSPGGGPGAFLAMRRVPAGGEQQAAMP